MWYGSYWKAQEAQETALGFAVSRDGRHWAKSPHNPSCGPIPNGLGVALCDQPSLARLEDGSWRIWYATRTRPRSSTSILRWHGEMVGAYALAIGA